MEYADARATIGHANDPPSTSQLDTLTKQAHALLQNLRDQNSVREEIIGSLIGHTPTAPPNKDADSAQTSTKIGRLEWLLEMLCRESVIAEQQLKRLQSI